LVVAPLLHLNAYGAVPPLILVVNEPVHPEVLEEGIVFFTNILAKNPSHKVIFSSSPISLVKVTTHPFASLAYTVYEPLQRSKMLNSFLPLFQIVLIGCFPPTIDVIIDPVQIVSPFRSFLIAFRLIKNPSHCFVVGKVSEITL